MQIHHPNNDSDITIELRDDERELMELIDDFSEAIEEKNIASIMSFYSDDIVAFDLMPPLKYEGIDDFRHTWNVLKDVEGPFSYEFHDVHLAANTDVAFSHSLNRMEGKLKNGKDMSCWFRYTAGYRKINGHWMIVHENSSVPVDMQTQKGLFDLQP